MRHGKTIKPLLLAAAILAPATTLAVLGLRAYRAESLLLRERYRQDQEAIVRLVGGRMSEAARKALEDLEARVTAHDPDATLETRFRAAHPLARHIFLVRRRRLVYPAVESTAREQRGRERRPGLGYLATELDVNNYVSRLREARRHARWVIMAQRAEASGRVPRATRLFRRASRGSSDPSAQALLGLARAERREGNFEDARRHLVQLRRRFGGRQDREGVSYALLADAGLVELGAVQLLLGMHQRLLKGEYLSGDPVRHFYLRWIVDRLEQVAVGALREEARHLRRVTADLFASERFGMLLTLHGVADLQQLAVDRIGSVSLDRRTVLILRQRGDAVVGYTVDEDYLGRRVARHQREVVPAGRGLQLSLGRVGEAAERPHARLLFSSALDPPLSHWTLAAHVPRSYPMDPLEQRGAIRRLGLFVGLILALLVGLLLTYRGVRRESELAQLKSDFASNVSHELKTPLTSIRMYAEMLEEGIAGTPGDRQRYQRVIIRESERLGRLIANVLDFSRVERGTRRYELQPESLADMTREAVETFRRLAEGERMRIEVQRNGEPPVVAADREAAVQSILNLLSNAAKYSPDEPRIEVELLAREEWAGVQVRDRGIGVPLAEQKRIFDDFYRAPDSRRIGVEGTGLGLALVRRHMKACGGKVELQSEQGKGSAFTLWFPRALEEGQEVEHVENPGDRG